MVLFPGQFPAYHTYDIYGLCHVKKLTLVFRVRNCNTNPEINTMQEEQVKFIYQESNTIRGVQQGDKNGRYTKEWKVAIDIRKSGKVDKAHLE